MDNIKALEQKIANAQNELKEAQNELERLKNKKPEHRFYKGQPVLVRDYDDGEWQEEILIGIVSNASYPFRCKDDYWKQCKLNPGKPRVINWVEWDGGKCPVQNDTLVLAQLVDGEIAISITYNWIWGRCNSDDDTEIVRYAIITPPEFLN